MRSFKEFLTESKDTAKIIREILKKEYGLGNRDVSVRVSGSSVNITIVSTKALPYYSDLEKIKEKLSKIRYDGAADEILSGGNIYVFLKLDYKLKDKVLKAIKEEFDAIKSKAKAGSKEKLFGGLDVLFPVNSEDGEFSVKYKGDSAVWEKGRENEYQFILAFLLKHSELLKKLKV